MRATLIWAVLVTACSGQPRPGLPVVASPEGPVLSVRRSVGGAKAEPAGPDGPLLRVWLRPDPSGGSSLPRAFHLRRPGGGELLLPCIPVDWGLGAAWQCAPWREWDHGIGRYRFEVRNGRGNVATSFDLDGTESQVVVHVRRGGSAHARPHRPWPDVELVEVSGEAFTRVELRNDSSEPIRFFDFYLRARSVHVSRDGSLTHLMPVPVCGGGMSAIEVAPGVREGIAAPLGFGGAGAYDVWITRDGPGAVVHEARLRVHTTDETPLEWEPSTVTERVWRPIAR